MSVPLMYTLRQMAASWGVPPWVVTGEPPTVDVVSRWVSRELVFRRLESG